MQGNSFNIPHYVSAESPEGLRIAMLRNNIKFRAQFNYYAIVFDGQKYTAWYYKESQESKAVLSAT
jgi:hypothetical protein